MHIPLHNHSEYSNIDGVSKPKEIAQRVIVDMGCPCCGLTDHGLVAGHLDFDKEIRKVGGKPIFGCELYHGVRFGEKLGNKRDQAHLIALAMTDEGLLNLWRLNDAAAQEPKFHHVGRNSWDDFERFHSGIVFTSACPAGLVAKGVLSGDYSDLNRYLDIMGDDFYIELTTYPGDQEFMDKDLGEPVRISDLNIAKYEIAQERGIPVVYGDDGHYAYPEQFEAHDAYVARSTGDSIYTPVNERKMYHPPGALCIKTEEEVRASLSYLPKSAVDEAIANSAAIGERADAHLPEVRRHLPVFVPSESPWVEKGKYEDEEADLLFLDLVEEGMRRCYGEDPEEQVVSQTQYEAEVFLTPPEEGAVALFHYFLMEWDMIQFCLNGGYHPELGPIEIGPGRGSAAGCIIARELGITDIDPLPYELYFERFWNPGRAKGFPDIDTDIEKGRRWEVKEYLTKRWGHNRVRSIGTVTRMKPKSVIEMMAKTCGISAQEEKELKTIVEQVPDIDILGVDQIGWSEESDPGKTVYVMHPSKEYPDNNVGDRIMEWLLKQPEKRQEHLARFLDFCDILCNRVAGYGVHASGVVVSDADLPEIAPCRFAGSADQRIPVTQFPMDEIDALMLIKLDLLGLRTLDVLSEWRRLMKERHDIDIVWSQLEWEFNDPEMWEQLAKFYAGIFQVEKGYAAKLCKEIKPKSVEDLSVIVALNRPGPIRSGAPESYILRRNGGVDDKFDGRKIPILAENLDRTYGWFLYQEQVIRFFRDMGYSGSDADAVRKILGKKQPEKWDAIYNGTGEWEDKSYLAMSSKFMDKRTADEIWRMLKEFGKYSFNKAHSVAYGTTGYRCNFAKYYGVVEDFVSLIRNVPKDKRNERMPQYINEARRLDIGIHGVDIETSGAKVDIGSNGDIYFGFSDVKYVNEEAAEYLIMLREEGADLSSPEALAEEVKKRSDIWKKENARLKKELQPKQEGKSPGQTLNAKHIQALYTAGAWERIEGYPTPMREMQEREKEMLNVLLTDNVSEAIAENEDLLDEITDTYEEALAPYDGEDMKFVLPGVIAEAREVQVKNGKNAGRKMGIVTIEWEGDSLEFAVFSDKWSGNRHMWHERTPGIFTIKYSRNNKTGRVGYSLESATKLN